MNLEIATNGQKFSKKFDQLYEQGKKCANDGELNIAFYRPSLKDREKYGNKIEKKLYLKPENLTLIQDTNTIKIGMLDFEEGLSSVSFIKRIFLKGYNEYPSTAFISLWDLFNQLKAYNSVDENINFVNYKKLFNIYKDERINDQLLFAENLNCNFFTKNGIFNSPTNTDEDKVRNLHSEIISFANENEINFTKYYAIVKFDGDRTGEWMRGNFLSDKNDLLNFQHAYSASLKEFVDDAFEKFSTSMGKIVYAGEDFLAFINLHHLYNLLDWFQKRHYLKFNSELREKGNTTVEGKFEILPGAEMTLSAGLTIAHYKEPLNEVLNQVRNAEEAAKSLGIGGILGISNMKHSGSIIPAIIPWNVKSGENTTSTLSILTNLHALLEHNEYSNMFINELLKENDKMKGEMPQNILRLEMKRLIGRSKNANATIEPQILFEGLSSLLGSNETIGKNDVTNFLNLLKVVEFITRKTKFIPA